MIDRMAMVRIMLKLMVEWIWYMIVIGASFCHVRRIMPGISGVPWVTSGTQKWNGASPSFIANAAVIV